MANKYEVMKARENYPRQVRERQSHPSHRVGRKPPMLTPLPPLFHCGVLVGVASTRDLQAPWVLLLRHVLWLVRILRPAKANAVQRHVQVRLRWQRCSRAHTHARTLGHRAVVVPGAQVHLLQRHVPLQRPLRRAECARVLPGNGGVLLLCAVRGGHPLGHPGRAQAADHPVRQLHHWDK